MVTPQLKVFRLNQEAKIPERATERSACFDIRSCLIDGEEVHGFNSRNVKFSQKVVDGKIRIKSQDRIMIPTGLILDIPDGYSVRFHPRSGTALKQGLILANCEGVVDSDYVEQSFIILMNTSDEMIVISHGDRICQAELFKDQELVIVETMEKPSQKTDRAGGFGSTGTK